MRKYCSFFLDGHCFGVRVEDVQEILLRQRMTRVALAPPVVAGLINLRGQIVTALDLRRRLGLPARADAGAVNVVVATDDGPVALLVDRTGDVVDAGDDVFEGPPDTLRSELRAIVRGAFKLPERLMLVLDLARITQLGDEPAEVDA